jgi:hypothetical protein
MRLARRQVRRPLVDERADGLDHGEIGFLAGAADQVSLARRGTVERMLDLPESLGVVADEQATHR